MDALPEVADHLRGVNGQRAVEPGRVVLLVAKLDNSRSERGKRRPPREHVGGGHRTTLGKLDGMCRARLAGCLVLRAVLLLCWRDTGHPQGGGSETYLQRIGAQLAAAGVDVTLRTARYPARRGEK